jgi:hypothetical protein
LMEITFHHPAPSNWRDGLDGVTQLEAAGANARVTLQLETFALVNPLLERARVAGAEILEFSVHSPNLSDAFIALTGHALRDQVLDAH